MKYLLMVLLLLIILNIGCISIKSKTPACQAAGDFWNEACTGEAWCVCKSSAEDWNVKFGECSCHCFNRENQEIQPDTYCSKSKCLDKEDEIISCKEVKK